MAEPSNPTQNVKIAVIDFAYSDTSGETRDQQAEHATRLRDFMTALRHDLEARGMILVVPNCGAAPCQTTTPADTLMEAAQHAGAAVMVVGAIHKMSTLIQWAKTTGVDTSNGAAILDKLFSFRGDDDESWRRAEIFIADQLTAANVAAKP